MSIYFGAKINLFTLILREQNDFQYLNPKYSLGKYFIKNIVNSLLIFNNNTPLNLKILM